MSAGAADIPVPRCTPCSSCGGKLRPGRVWGGLWDGCPRLPALLARHSKVAGTALGPAEFPPFPGTSSFPPGFLRIEKLSNNRKSKFTSTQRNLPNAPPGAGPARCACSRAVAAAVGPSCAGGSAVPWGGRQGCFPEPSPAGCRGSHHARCSGRCVGTRCDHRRDALPQPPRGSSGGSAPPSPARSWTCWRHSSPRPGTLTSSCGRRSPSRSTCPNPESRYGTC